MGIKISGCSFENNGTGIKITGNKMHVDIDNSNFMNNGKDIEMQIGSESDINIERIKSMNCRTESITISEYHISIENLIKQVNSLEIHNTDKNKIISNLRTISENKEKPEVLKRVICETYGICKSVGASLILHGILTIFGWK